jgi:hypothetical protein
VRLRALWVFSRRRAQMRHVILQQHLSCRVTKRIKHERFFMPPAETFKICVFSHSIFQRCIKMSPSQHKWQCKGQSVVVAEHDGKQKKVQRFSRFHFT